MWLKIKQEGLPRFWSMCPLTRVPFWSRFFEPQPCGPVRYLVINQKRWVVYQKCHDVADCPEFRSHEFALPEAGLSPRRRTPFSQCLFVVQTFQQLRGPFFGEGGDWAHLSTTQGPIFRGRGVELWACVETLQCLLEFGSFHQLAQTDAWC